MKNTSNTSIRTQVLIGQTVLAVALMLQGCVDDSQNKRSGTALNASDDAKRSPEKNSGSPDGAPSSESKNEVASAFVSKEYIPQNGDRLSLTQKVKSWSGAETEPSEWQNVTKATELVTTLYPKGVGGSCSHLVQRRSDGEVAWVLRGCPQETLGCEPASSTKCEESPLDPRDFGSTFKGAPGTLRTCRSQQEVEGGNNLITLSVSQVFTSPQALVPDRVVYRLDKTCSQVVAAGGDLNVDPCKSEDAGATRHVTEWSLDEQVRGKVRDLAKKPIFAEMTSSGLPSKMSFAPPSCVLASGQLTVTQSVTVCQSNTLQQMAISVTGVPVTSSIASALPASGVSLSTDSGNHTATADGDCTITVEPDLGAALIQGEVSCTSAFAASETGSSPIHMKSYKFSCLAPESMEGVGAALSALESKYAPPSSGGGAGVGEGSTTTTAASNGTTSTVNDGGGASSTSTTTTLASSGGPCVASTLTVDPTTREKNMSIACDGSLTFFNADDDGFATITRGGVTHMVYMCNDISAEDLAVYNLKPSDMKSCQPIPQLNERGFVCDPSSDTLVRRALTAIDSCLGLRNARVPVRRGDTLRLYSVSNNSLPVSASFSPTGP